MADVNRFQIVIDNLDTSAMAEDTREAVHQALSSVQARVLRGYDSGNILDANGNKVGKWGFILEGESDLV